MSSYHHDVMIAVERGDLDHFEALELMASMVEKWLEDPLLTTAEIESLEAGLELADRTLLDVVVDEWSTDALGDLPTTDERT